MAFSNYYPESLINENERELRREYTKLRDIGRKRLRRLEKSEFSESEIAKYWSSGEIPKLRDLQTKEEIAFALADLYGFISSPYSTLKGARAEQKKKKERIEKIIGGDVIDIGYDGKPYENPYANILYDRYGLDLDNPIVFQQFIQFMNTSISKFTSDILSSDRVLALFKVLKEKGVTKYTAFQHSMKDFMFFVQNIENLEAVEVPKNEKATIKKYKELIQSEIYHGRDRSLLYKESVSDKKLDDLQATQNEYKNFKKRTHRRKKGKK